MSYVALNKSLKNLHDYRCEGHWSIVIQARGFIVLRYRDDDGFFKGGGNYRGSKGLVEDRSEQTSKRSAHDLRTWPVIPSVQPLS